MTPPVQPYQGYNLANSDTLPNLYSIIHGNLLKSSLTKCMTSLVELYLNTNKPNLVATSVNGFHQYNGGIKDQSKSCFHVITTSLQAQVPS